MHGAPLNTVCDYEGKVAFYTPWTGQTLWEFSPYRSGCSPLAYFNFPGSEARYPNGVVFSAHWKDAAMTDWGQIGPSVQLVSTCGTLSGGMCERVEEVFETGEL